MDYPHFSVNFVNFGIHKLSTLIKMGLHSCVKKKKQGENEQANECVAHIGWQQDRMDILVVLHW